MSKKEIATPKAPGAVGPYSQAIVANGFVFASGQIPLSVEKEGMADNVADQAKQALSNAKAILEEAGSSMEKVVKTTVFLADINDFKVVNEVYASFFVKPYPARSCFAVKDLPLGAKVEVEVIALA